MIIENKSLDESPVVMNNVEDKPPVRCDDCDREMDHYITFISPTNEPHTRCWECYDRSEKHFNAKRGFRREARHGDIPR